jgi:mannan endo-1,4-beta-mannosidase
VKMRILAVFLAVAALVTVVVGAEVVFGHKGHKHFAARPDVRNFPDNFVGIVSYNVPKFDEACRCSPNVAVHYLPIGGSEDLDVAHSILSTGAIPMLELEPQGVSLGAISSGTEDTWLNKYAHAVNDLHSPVIMSFAPEANGNWYPWGNNHVAPSALVAAWRHVVTVFREAGARNVKWAWIMNVQFPGSENIRLLWPGEEFVDILGIDGYLVKRLSFSTFFGPTIVAMRTISSDPLLITETAAAPSIGKAVALNEIVAGVAQYGLAGFIWFDVVQHGSISRQDWSLEHDPAALKLYYSEVKRIR